MAKFTEVFHQIQRMCNGTACNVCRLNFGDENYIHCGARPYGNAHVDEIEKIVMDWAKEHPEPRYPTWQEWLKERGVISAGGFYEKAFMPIPDDIAEKLGLTKREIRNGQN